MLKQSLQQKLLQKLSPQQIQLMKLLQVPTLELEARIKQELEANPALEEGAEKEETLDDLDLQEQEQSEALDDFDFDEAEDAIELHNQFVAELDQQLDAIDDDQPPLVIAAITVCL